MPGARCGPEVLAEYLRRNDCATAQPASATLGEFREWLAARIAEQQHSPAFVQQCRVRELVRAHRDALHHHKDTVRRARLAYEASPQRDRLERLAARLAGLERAVDGLTRAVAEGQADPRKLADFRAERDGTRVEFVALSHSLAERVQLDAAEAALDRLREEIGLAAAETELATLRRQRGGRLVKSGRRFEGIAEEAAWKLLVPALLPVPGPVVYLSGVTLGIARAELDGVFVAVPSQETEAVEVLALVEAKRNINDVGKGFRTRQENLAWLTGERGGYDAEAYRTRTFAAGHFDRPAHHTQGGRTYRFDPTSFRRFERDARTGDFLGGLCFVVEDRPLVGIGTPQLGRLMHRLAADLDFDLHSDATIRRYHAQVRAMSHGLQTRDVLELYASEASYARQIVFVTP
jgi:hypothetical protein